MVFNNYNNNSSYNKLIIPLVLLFIVINIPAIYKDDGQSNAYVLLAQSFIEGKTALPEIEGYSYMDMIEYNGEHYLPYPPFPSILLIPYVAIFGSSYVPSSVIAILLSCLNIFLISSILRTFELKNATRFWLLIAFFFATPYWFVLTTSNYHYGFAQIISTTAILLFLNELLTKKRWWLIGIFLGMAFLSRQTTVFCGILALFTLISGKKNSGKYFWKSLLLLTVSLGLFITLYLVYNFMRFSNPLSTGYEYIKYIGILAERVNEYGVFSLHYIPFNFYVTFIKGHNLIFGGNDMLQLQGIDVFGTSLTIASPFIIISLRAHTEKPLKYIYWVIIFIILSIHLLYHNNGYPQLNTSRFTLDFFPILFLLIASGSSYISERLLKNLIIYSVLLNMFSFAVYLFYK